MKKLMNSVAVAALFVISAPYVQAVELLDATDPAKVMEVAKGYGKATLGEDGDGDPKIEGKMNGLSYQVLFYGCNEHKNCKDIQMVAQWSDPISLAKVNEFNSTKRFGTAYLSSDGKKCGIKMSLTLDGGVSVKNLDETFDWWGVTMKSFSEHISQ